MVRKGFTLLELLISIGIIGVLVSIGVMAYSTAQRSSRDSRRIADMKAIQQGFEQYYSANSDVYPSSCDPTVDIKIKTYLPSGIPNDPKGSTIVYSSTCTSTTYCFCASLENTKQKNASVDCTGTAGNFFCVNQLQ